MEVAVVDLEALSGTLEAVVLFLVQQMEGTMGRGGVLEPGRTEAECPFCQAYLLDLRKVTELLRTSVS